MLRRDGVDLSLDTGIFLGYAQEPAYEQQHDACNRVFQSVAHRRFVSESVYAELSRRVRKRIELYAALVVHVAHGGKIDGFDLSPWNKSDASLGRRIMREVARAKPAPLLSYLRAERARFEARVKEGLDRTESSRIPQSGDDVLEAALNTILAPADAGHLRDYLCWAASIGPTAFVTVDRGILDARDRVLEIGRSHFDLTTASWAVIHAATLPERDGNQEAP